jgi:hypothetical protein
MLADDAIRANLDFGGKLCPRMDDSRRVDVHAATSYD